VHVSGLLSLFQTVVKFEWLNSNKIDVLVDVFLMLQQQ